MGAGVKVGLGVGVAVAVGAGVIDISDVACGVAWPELGELFS
jgi:hypothetical protein